MFRLEEIGDAVEGVVIDENRAKQRLFRLDIMRRQPERGIGAREEKSSGKVFDCWHKTYAKSAESVRYHPFVPRRSGQKEGILGPEGLVPAIHTGRKFS